MKLIRKHLGSPAMIVACAALMVALGGVSYAAAVLPKNSVGTAQIKKQSVSRAKIKQSAITGAKVKNQSLTAADFKAGQLPAGPEGPKGDPGPQGPKGDPGGPLGANSIAADDVQDGSLGTAEFASSIPAARVTRSGIQGVPPNTATPLAFDTERYDTAAIHATDANTSRLVAPVNGIYAVTAHVAWHNVAGPYALSLRKNGGNYIATTADVSASPSNYPQEVTTQARLQAGDFVEAVVTQAGGPAFVGKADEFSPEFAITWLAPGP
jgi:hypothetical protein